MESRHDPGSGGLGGGEYAGAAGRPGPGSDVYATIYVASETATAGRATGVLMATDREIGTGSSAVQPILGFGTGPGSNAQGTPLPDGGLCASAGELCWTKFDLSFTTTRPAFSGEQVTLQIQLLGVRAWAFGHEGGHASKVAIVAAPMPEAGLELGATVDEPADGSTVASGSEVVAGGRVAYPDPGTDPDGAGDHPTRRTVEVSLDDPGFGSPVEASVDEESGTWSASLGTIAGGAHTIYARARIDTTSSPVASSTFRVAPDARVEWQVVDRNAAPGPVALADRRGRRDVALLVRDERLWRRSADDRQPPRRGRPRDRPLERSGPASGSRFGASGRSRRPDAPISRGDRLIRAG